MERQTDEEVVDGERITTHDLHVQLPHFIRFATVGQYLAG